MVLLARPLSKTSLTASAVILTEFFQMLVLPAMDGARVAFSIPSAAAVRTHRAYVPV
jgi:hypothetical protein